MPLYNNNNNNDDGCAVENKIHYLQTSFKRYYYHIMTYNFLVNNMVIILASLREFHHKKS